MFGQCSGYVPFMFCLHSVYCLGFSLRSSHVPSMPCLCSIFVPSIFCLWSDCILSMLCLHLSLFRLCFINVPFYYCQNKGCMIDESLCWTSRKPLYPQDEDDQDLWVEDGGQWDEEGNLNQSFHCKDGNDHGQACSVCVQETKPLDGMSKYFKGCIFSCMINYQTPIWEDLYCWGCIVMRTKSSIHYLPGNQRLA